MAAPVAPPERRPAPHAAREHASSTGPGRTALALVPGAVILGILVVALLLGGTSILLIAAATVGVVLLVLAVRLRGAASCGAAAFAAGVLTCTWNGVGIGSLQLGDLCFLLAVLLLLPTLARNREAVRALPSWLVVPAALLVAIMVIHLVAPVDPIYLASRTVLADPYVTFGSAAPRVTGNVLNAARWLISLLALPLLAVLVTRIGAVRVLTLVRLWVVGGVISAVVSVTDYLHLTAISAELLPIVDIGGRQAGLSGHPNQLAVAVVITVPFAVWLFLSRRDRWALGALVLLLVGVLLTGSRGGAVAAPVGMIATVVGATLLDRRVATRAFWFSYPMLLLPVIYLAVVGQTLLSLSNRDNSTEGASNAARRTTGAQAIEDWQFSPFRGIGLQVVAEAHNIYLQMLASGGVVLALGGLVLAVGSLGATWRHRLIEQGLPLAIGISIAGWLAIGVIENQLTDRYLYVPISLLVALIALNRTSTDPTTHHVGGHHAPAS